MVLARLFFWVSSLCLSCLLTSVPAAALEVESPRVEYTVRPLAIDVARPRLSWTMSSAERAERQSAYRVLVASTPERLAADRGDVWDSGKVFSNENFGVVYAGAPLRSNQRYHWKVRVWDGRDRASAWSTSEWWQTALLDSAEWSARWISAPDEHGSPLLRRDFTVRKPVAQAIVHAFGFGWYRLSLNGEDVGDRVLAPVNSNYPKALFYDSYDATTLVQEGANAIGVWLGRGYNENYSKYGYRWLGPLAARVQLELRFTDGSTETIATDEQWRASASPLLDNHIYDGESYDARREQPGWNRAGFDDRGWSPVIVRELATGPLRACMMPPIKVTETLRPIGMTEVKPGVFVYDLGQNIAGWVRLRVRGAAGIRVTLRHAEGVYGDGSLDVTTNRAARATDTYVLKGDGDEIYEPRFTYHGFRYVELTGFPGRPTIDALEGRVVHAAVDHAGSFRSSDLLLNRIHENFRWSIRNNSMGIPTDTATRDERTPCLMDSLAVEETAMFNFDLAQYYTKWLHDIRGDVGAPPNWAGDQVVLPSLLYWHYGDTRILEEHFANLKKMTDAFAAEAEASKHWATGFGDWAPPGQPGDYETSFSEGEIVNTAFFYRSATITADVAERLGETADADRYRRLAGDIRERFNRVHFRAETATYGSGRQVTSVLPLAFGLVPDDQRGRVAEALHRRVVETDRGHLDTGIFGTRYLFDVLIDHGFAEAAYAALTKTTYPSYGYQIRLGATTTWEQWSYRGSMQTHNHAMFSGPGVTFYTRLAGIRAAAPGFREITIKPTRPSGLVQVEASLQTMMGPVVSAWRDHEGFVHRVQIPPNATATVHVRATDPAQVREGERVASEAPAVRFLRLEDGHAVFEIGSGSYAFSVAP
jgi:alpha-L-rhamnosidase